MGGVRKFLSLVGFPRFIRLVIAEIKIAIVFTIIQWPNSPLGNKLRLVYWRWRLKNPHIFYIGRGAKILGSDKLCLGEEFVLGENAALQIGHSDPVYIGNLVGIARGSFLRSANHRTDDVNIPIREQGHIANKIEYKGQVYSIVIEDDVLIGANAIILTGAFLRKGCVVSAGSVVSSEFPAYSIVVGNPARVVLNRQKLSQLKNAK